MTRPALERIAETFGLDVTRVARPDAFDAAIEAAVGVLGSFDAVIRELLEGGPMRGSQRPWAVVLARLRGIPEAHARRQTALAERAELARWREIDRAARRGGTLRSLVDREVIFADEAAEQIGVEFPDDNLRAVALAALQGGQR